MELMAGLILAGLILAGLPTVGHDVLTPRSLEGHVLHVASAKAASTEPTVAQSPKQFIEAALGGKIVRYGIDPTDRRRAVFYVKKDKQVSEHVLEAGLNRSRELSSLRIITTGNRPAGVSPVIEMPLTIAAPCRRQCEKACGKETECRLDCMFRCILE